MSPDGAVPRAGGCRRALLPAARPTRRLVAALSLIGLLGLLAAAASHLLGAVFPWQPAPVPPAGRPSVAVAGNTVTISGDGSGSVTTFTLPAGRYTITWRDEPPPTRAISIGPWRFGGAPPAPGRTPGERVGFVADLRDAADSRLVTLVCGLGGAPPDAPCRGEAELPEALPGGDYTLAVDQAAGAWEVSLQAW